MAAESAEWGKGFSRRHGGHGELLGFRIFRRGRCGAVRDLVIRRFGASGGEEIAREGAGARRGEEEKAKTRKSGKRKAERLKGEGRKIFFSRRHGEHGGEKGKFSFLGFGILRCGRCGAGRVWFSGCFGAGWCAVAD